ncbi:nitrous oxide reductase accessory protein NosL [Fulvivirga kasyanovii]|uniref:Nitrous oxide reductase n=1 Tax=Fulvivirga kasyanovii TaxID=396812 RepID=A0ABW9RTR2_9BACT|nr:nitrous oxide reductase accessory protein NosL [Fulvivirga kasyanovii]MTI27205.1 hypothetical protein [Fulvivirga kasyanovii]
MKKLIYIIITCMVFAACKPEPEPIHYGQDGCSYCKMTIVDPRYGSELVTDKGKVYKFDAVECLINYMNENAGTSFAHVLVSTFDQKTLKEAAGCYYLRSGNLPSPMGMYITGVSDKQVAEKFDDEYGGQLYSWDELLKSFDSLPTIQPRALR